MRRTDSTKADDSVGDLTDSSVPHKKQKQSAVEYIKIKIDLSPADSDTKLNLLTNYKIHAQKRRKPCLTGSGKESKRLTKKLKFYIQIRRESGENTLESNLEDQIKLAKNKFRKIFAPYNHNNTLSCYKTSPKFCSMENIQNDKNSGRKTVLQASEVKKTEDLTLSEQIATLAGNSVNTDQIQKYFEIPLESNSSPIEKLNWSKILIDSTNNKESICNSLYPYKIETHKEDFQEKANEVLNKFFASVPANQKMEKSILFEGIGPLEVNTETGGVLSEVRNSEYAKNFIYDLEIVDNQNRREKIKVSHPPSGKLPEITLAPNQIDKALRDSWYKELDFMTDYTRTEDYKPISIQKNQEEQFNYKSHFIRKKQSSQNVNIKRCTGVSYVKESESQQLNVNHIFKKLPHLMIQASTSCEVLEDYKEFMEALYDKIFCNEQSDYSLLLAWFESDDENKMREYLLYPKKRFEIANNQFWLLKNLENLWYFLKEKYFLAIHLAFDREELISAPKLTALTETKVRKMVEESDLIVGFLFKKCTSGRKAFIKSFLNGTQYDSDLEDEASDTEKEEEIKTKEAEKSKKIHSKTKTTPTKNTIKAEIPVEPKVQEEPVTEKKLLMKAKKSSKKPGPRKNKNDVQPVSSGESLIISREGPRNDFTTDMITPSSEEEDSNTIPYKIAYKPLANADLSLDLSNESSEDEQFPLIGSFKDSKTQLQPIIASQTQVTPQRTISNDEPEKKPVSKKRNKKEKGVTVEFKQENQKMTIEEPKKRKEEKATKLVKEGVKEKNAKDLKEANDSTAAHDDKKRVNPYEEFIDKYNSGNPKAINTIGVRIELYTSEQSWKNATKLTKNLLFTFISHMKDALEPMLRDWTTLRRSLLEMPLNSSIKNKKSNQSQQTLEYDERYLACKAIRTIQFDSSMSQGNRATNSGSTISWEFVGGKNQKMKKTSARNKICTFHFSDKTFHDNASLIEMQELHKPRTPHPFAIPLYVHTTKDCFAFDLIAKRSYLSMRGRQVLRTEYFFDPNSVPSNYSSFADDGPSYRVGVITYDDFFTHEELNKIEEQTYETERKCFKDHFLPMTSQMTATSEKVKRTKFFFGARYIWTKQQLSEPFSVVGAGVRIDVSEPPRWMKELVERPMVEADIIEKDFVNSIAMNIYHDGNEGLAQHFDDAVRFRQPIFTLRLFSDSRLSFGCQLYGFCNGAFCVPMARGCITVLEENSYAANGIKHCVRPVDMTGKSAAIILRQMHHKVMEEAIKFDEFVEFPTAFSTLSTKENAVLYSDLKRLEVEQKGK